MGCYSERRFGPWALGAGSRDALTPPVDSQAWEPLSRPDWLAPSGNPFSLHSSWEKDGSFLSFRCCWFKDRPRCGKLLSLLEVWAPYIFHFISACLFPFVMRCCYKRGSICLTNKTDNVPRKNLMEGSEGILVDSYLFVLLHLIPWSLC